MGDSMLMEKYGFIVMDGKDTLFGTLSGQTREVLHIFSDDHVLHRARGESRMEFALLLKNKVRNYLTRTAELATRYYINPSTRQPNVTGLILAPSAQFNARHGYCIESGFLDIRLAEIVSGVLTVSSGVEKGFIQAIELSYQFQLPIVEKQLMKKFIHEIIFKTGKYVFGVDDTLNVLKWDSGAVKTLIVWENIPIHRFLMNNTSTGETVIKYLNDKQEYDAKNFINFHVEEKTPLPVWLANESMRLGCALQLVSNKTNESFQFWQRFGGIAAILDHHPACPPTGKCASFSQGGD